MKYYKRIVDEEINNKLSFMGAVLIKGPKWCGKTTSAKKVAKSVIEMQDPDNGENYLNIANEKPSILLNGDKPRLIDEWQVAPKLWDAVRYSVDKIGMPGQYILTGSVTPEKKETSHTGTGRFAIIDMKPMTLYESEDSNGKISIKDILMGKRDIDGIESKITYEDIAYLVCRGGWPSSLAVAKDKSLEIAKNYIDVLCESDISKVDDVKRNPLLAKMILRAYARHISTIDSDTSIYEDVKANYSSISEKTVSSYINAFKKLYVISEIEAWNPNIRSKTAIRTGSKKSMIDPSIASAALGCSPKTLEMDYNTLGLLFENLVNRDLSVYVGKLSGTLNHYRDRYGLECDSVIHFSDGKYALVETKLGDSQVSEAEKHLLELKKLILENEKKLGEPEFLMIITGSRFAYTTKEGVLVVPIGCLKD